MSLRGSAGFSEAMGDGVFQRPDASAQAACICSSRAKPKCIICERMRLDREIQVREFASGMQYYLPKSCL
jgi:hypothetical protein